MHHFRFLLPVFVFCALLFSAPFASAETPLSFAVVNVDLIMNEAKAGKALQKKRNTAREKFLAELSKKEQKLGEEGKAIFEKRGSLSEEEFNKQRQDYEKKLLEVRRLTQSKKRSFENASNVSLRLLQDFLTETVQEISKEKGYAIVFSARNVVTGESSLDITQETLKRMDAKKKNIPFDVKD